MESTQRYAQASGIGLNETEGYGLLGSTSTVLNARDNALSEAGIGRDQVILWVSMKSGDKHHLLE